MQSPGRETAKAGSISLAAAIVDLLASLLLCLLDRLAFRLAITLRLPHRTNLHIHQSIMSAQTGAGIQELMAAETRASQIVAEARMGKTLDIARHVCRTFRDHCGQLLQWLITYESYSLSSLIVLQCACLLSDQAAETA